MNSREFRILGLADACPLCIEPPDGRVKEKRPPIFVVGSDGGYNGAVCAPHIAALIKAEEGAKAAPQEEPKKPAQPARALAPPAAAAAGGATA